MTVTRTHTYPEGTPPGVYTITATDGINTAQAQITILDPTPNTVTVNPDSIAAGGTVTVAGSGYPTETAGTVTVAPAAGGDPVTTVDVTTDINGAIPDTSVLIPSGTPAGEYTVNADVGGETGQATLTVTAQQQLAAPTGLSSPAQTATTIDVTWTASANADRYVVEYKLSTDTPWTPRPAVTANSDTIPGLTGGQSYDIRVIAQDSTGTFTDSEPSEPITQNTAPSPLAFPAGLSVSATTTNSITLTWTANADAAGYVVQYREQDTTEWTPNPQVDAGTTTDTVTGLTPGSVYEFQAQSVGDGTTHASSEFGPSTPVTGTASEPLAVPTTLATGGETEASVELSWTAVDNATVYHIQYKLTDDTDWIDWDTDPATSPTTVDGLAGASSYDFHLKAVGDGAGYTDSDYTEPITTNTL